MLQLVILNAETKKKKKNTQQHKPKKKQDVISKCPYLYQCKKKAMNS